MRKFIAGAIVGAALVGGVASATPHGYHATVRCPNLAEDSAAHVRLVEYTPTEDGVTLIYRCQRTGY